MTTPTSPNSPAETALAPQLEVPADWLAPAGRLFTTLEPVETVSAINDASALEGVLGRVLIVTDLVIHEVTIVLESGEIVTAPRTILVCKDGKAFSATSRGVLAGLRQIMGLFGNPPWREGLKLKAEAVRTRRGFRTFKITLVK